MTVCVLPDVSEEDFRLLFAELRERTYSLYCFTSPKPADGDAAVVLSSGRDRTSVLPP